MPEFKTPVKLTPKVQNMEAMQFLSVDILSIIQWLGADFYALTNGQEIGVKGHKIESATRDIADLSYPLGNGIIVIYDQERLTVTAVPVNSWIVRDPVKGYMVMSSEKIAEHYDVTDPSAGENSLIEIPGKMRVGSYYGETPSTDTSED